MQAALTEEYARWHPHKELIQAGGAAVKVRSLWHRPDLSDAEGSESDVTLLAACGARLTSCRGVLRAHECRPEAQLQRRRGARGRGER